MLHPIEKSAANYYTQLVAQIHDPERAMTHTTERYDFTAAQVLSFVEASNAFVAADLHDPQMGELV